MEGYLAEIRMFAGNFNPRGWLFCQGQILSIAQNTAVFALVGTIYGGNGQTTFAVPDFRGRVDVGTGTGAGLPPVDLGQVAGSNQATLTLAQMPAHTHTVSGSASRACKSGAGNSDSPVGNIPASSASDEIYAAPAGGNGSMAPVSFSGTTSVAGSGQPFSVMQPYLGMNFIFCIEGIFPSRN